MESVPGTAAVRVEPVRVTPARRVEPVRVTPAPRLELVAAAVCVATLGAAALGAIAPAAHAVAAGPVTCPFHAVTGLPCPFCGLTHSLLALGAGDWRASLHLNPLGPLLLVLAGPGLYYTGRAVARGVRARPPRALAPVALAVVTAAWAVQLAGGVA